MGTCMRIFRGRTPQALESAAFCLTDKEVHRSTARSTPRCPALGSMPSHGSPFAARNVKVAVLPMTARRCGAMGKALLPSQPSNAVLHPPLLDRYADVQPVPALLHLANDRRKAFCGWRPFVARTMKGPGAAFHQRSNLRCPAGEGTSQCSSSARSLRLRRLLLAFAAEWKALLLPHIPVKYRIKHPVWIVDASSPEEARKHVIEFYESGGLRFISAELQEPRPLWKRLLWGH